MIDHFQNKTWRRSAASAGFSSHCFGNFILLRASSGKVEKLQGEVEEVYLYINCPFINLYIHIMLNETCWC